MSHHAYIEGAFQISFRQELVEIRDIGTPRPRVDSFPVRIADSQKGCLPMWAKPRSLAPRLTLSPEGEVPFLTQRCGRWARHVCLRHFGRGL